MFAYLVVLLISCFSCYIALKNIRNKVIFLFFSVLAIIVPSLMAGYRDNTVGHDLLAYLVPNFNILIDIKSIKELSEFIFLSGLEPFWIAFNYIITRFTDDIFWSYFIQQVIVLTLFYSTCLIFRKQLNATLLYFLLIFTFFCFSMSANRQIFAIALVVYSTRFILSVNHKSIFKFITTIVLSSFFHRSALLALLIYPIFQYSPKTKNIPSYKLLIICAIGLIIYFSFENIISILVNIGIFDTKYLRYSNANYNVHKIDMAYWFIMLYLSIKIPLSVYSNFSIITILIILITLLCGTYNDVASRAAMYFMCFVYISFLTSIKQNTKCRHISLILIAITIILFIYTALATGYAEAIPYTSKELGVRFN